MRSRRKTQKICYLQFRIVDIKQIDDFLKLWDDNNLKTLWKKIEVLSDKDIAFVVAWMTVMIRDDSEVKLSQWLVWLETKSKNI